MHAGKIHVIVALKGLFFFFSPPSRSTLDTSLTILLNCNPDETCMLNQSGALLSKFMEMRERGLR